MISAADRLGIIKALGGRELTINGQPVWAIYRRPQVQAGSIDGGLRIATPYLTCRLSDVEDLAVNTSITIDGEVFRTLAPPEPDGDNGLAFVALGKEV